MKRYALFVGINEYKDQSISRLRCAGNDAKALCMQFAKSGFETSTLLLNSEASCSRIADELTKMMEKISKGDLFVFYFAGHGILHNNAHHLVVSDANINFKTGLFPVQNLLDHIGAEKEIHRMFILDCCRADLQHGRGDSYTGEFSRKISLTGGMSGTVGFSPCITLCSCSHKEKAYEDVDHGYFTKAFLSTITDEKVKDFSDFQTMLQKNMASPHPQHIDWSGQLDLWKQVKLFPTWGKKVTVQTFSAPDEFYTILMQSEDLEKILKEKNLTISKDVTYLKRVAKLAADYGDFTKAIKKLQEFISLAKEAIIAEEKRIAEQERLKKERKIAEEKRRAEEKRQRQLLQFSPDGKTVTGVSDKNVTHIVIPSGVTSIGDCAFEDCSNLVSVDLPSGLTSIGVCAFSGCSNLVSVKLPPGVSSIGDGAFSCCSNLVSVKLPPGVSSIGDGAFMCCSCLKSIVIPSGVTSINYYTFHSCSSLTSVELPSGLTSIGDFAFASCSSLRSVVIPSGVNAIGVGAFGNCSSLRSIVIPFSVNTIGEGTFRKCNNLNVVEIPKECKYCRGWLGVASFPSSCEVIRK